MAAERRMAVDGELLSAWRHMPPFELAAVINRALGLSHSLVESPDGSNRERVPLNCIVASLAMKRHSPKARLVVTMTELC
jgi:hypothetical protein